MNGLLMMIIAIVVLGGAYLIYGRYLAKTWGIDPKAKTPAYELEDGADYVPADTNVVFGHQFASIAGAGPINGPIQAAIFGWVPVLLWVLIGGVSNFLQVIGLPKDVVFTLINLAVSAFALTSLDSVARVGRLSFQELFLDASIKDEDMGPVRKVLTNKYFATIITLVLAYLLAKAGYASIWPLFASANQLLSALALVACAVFLKRTKRKGFMLWIPKVVMIAVIFTALGMTIWQLTSGLVDGTYAWISGMTTMVNGASVLTAWGACLQLVFAVLILALGVVVVIQGVKKLFGKEAAPAAA